MKYGEFADVNLARYTSWRLGGPAKRVFIPESISALSEFYRNRDKAEPLYLLGLGSNTLIRDGGFDGTIVVFSASGLQGLALTGENTIRAEAGVSCGKLVRFAAREHLGGMFFLAGIPGTVGGALQMNAGAHGGETWDHVVSLEMMNADGEIIKRSADEFQAGYRHIVKPADEIFVAAEFSFEPCEKGVALADIKKVLVHREETQPGNLPNGGSVFRNPEGDYAARLIEACGLKGTTYGNSRISEKHANFIVHNGKGYAKEVEHLIDLICETVASNLGVELVPEIKVIGCGGDDNNQ